MIEVAMNTDAMLLRSTANAIQRSSLPNPSVPVHDFESLGWADLPVMIQRTEHPSFSNQWAQTKQQENRQPQSISPLAPATIAVNFGAAPTQPSITSKQNTFELSWAKPQSFTTFGWGDFPIGADGGRSPPLQKKTTPQLPLEPVSKNLQPFKRPREQPFKTITPSTEITSSTQSLNEATGSSNTGTKTARRVLFVEVHIREHSICLGDHPLCNSYPVSLDWSRGEDRVMTVDDYEEQRRSSSGAVKMDVLERRSVLAESMDLTLTQVDSLEQERIRRTRGTVELLRTNSSLASNIENCG